MYKSFFDLRERPFKLVPNPAYLYLSPSHEEALAHLTYAISEGDGFVAITGEVGTGKTTLCRAFLENLDEGVEAAYIFNPKLNAVELLKAINDEFAIDSGADNAKELIDGLNAFLMARKGEGKRAILVIDEAQNLSKEVLEQLRLLSNLETTEDKLLQIILIGQPELGEVLDSHDMRQLGQRITLSCLLRPLSWAETREYIQHRINVASAKTGIRFDRGAYRAIHRYSRGIPRLINIVCDRALLTAYVEDRLRITAGVARRAIRELAGMGDIKRVGLEGTGRLVLGSVALLALVATVLYQLDLLSPEPPPIEAVTATVAEAEPPVAVAATPSMTAEEVSPFVAGPEVVVESPADDPRTELGALLQATTRRSSRHTALKTILARWNGGVAVTQALQAVDDDDAFFQQGAERNGLLIRRIDADLGMIERLDLPAVLELYLPDNPLPRYLVLGAIEEGNVVLWGDGSGDGTEHTIEVPPEALNWYWSGIAYVGWKNFHKINGTIPLSASDRSILNMKLLMHEIGYDDIELTPLYDDRTREVVRAIQGKYGLEVDGLVGSLTKIALYKERGLSEVPRLARAGRSESEHGSEGRGEIGR